MGDHRDIQACKKPFILAEPLTDPPLHPITNHGTAHLAAYHHEEPWAGIILGQDPKGKGPSLESLPLPEQATDVPAPGEAGSPAKGGTHALWKIPGFPGCRNPDRPLTMVLSPSGGSVINLRGNITLNEIPTFSPTSLSPARGRKHSPLVTLILTFPHQRERG